MLLYRRRLPVVYLIRKAMRRPLLMNKQQRSALFLCLSVKSKQHYGQNAATIIHAPAHRTTVAPDTYQGKSMNKHLMLLLTAAIAIGMASCSTGRYVNNSLNFNTNQTQVVLSKANFQVVKHVKVNYVYKNLHSMRFNANQLKESAYAALVKEANLTGAQTIINVTMEQKQRESQNFWTFVFGFPKKYEQAILVSGTVIEFLPEGTAPQKTEMIESTIYAEPMQDTEYQDTTKEKPIENDIQKEDEIIQDETTSDNKVLPQVPSINGASEYTLLQARYAAEFPSFWESIVKMRKYYLMISGWNDLETIQNFLLSNKENKIIALMNEIKDKNISKEHLASIFLKYANE